MSPQHRNKRKTSMAKSNHGRVGEGGPLMINYCRYLELGDRCWLQRPVISTTDHCHTQTFDKRIIYCRNHTFETCGILPLLSSPLDLLRILQFRYVQCWPWSWGFIWNKLSQSWGAVRFLWSLHISQPKRFSVRREPSMVGRKYDSLTMSWQSQSCSTATWKIWAEIEWHSCFVAISPLWRIIRNFGEHWGL